MKRYRFKKKFNAYEGSIPEGSEITIMEENGNAVYFNGGLVHQAYQDIIKHIVEDNRLRNEFLIEENITYNKV